MIISTIYIIYIFTSVIYIYTNIYFNDSTIKTCIYIYVSTILFLINK